jgi:TonB family protein
MSLRPLLTYALISFLAVTACFTQGQTPASQQPAPQWEYKTVHSDVELNRLVGEGWTFVSMASDPQGQHYLLKRLRSTPGDTATSPRLLHKVEPEYPQEARNKGIEGVVRLYLVVDKNGSPKSIRVLKSLDPRLDEAAIDAVRIWRFQPGTKSGQPVDVEAQIDVSFRLNKQPADGLLDAWDPRKPPTVTPAAAVVASSASSTAPTLPTRIQPTSEAAKAPSVAERPQPTPVERATAPKILRKIQPLYTPEARDKGIQGDGNPIDHRGQKRFAFIA